MPDDLRKDDTFIMFIVINYLQNTVNTRLGVNTGMKPCTFYLRLTILFKIYFLF